MARRREVGIGTALVGERGADDHVIAQRVEVLARLALRVLIDPARDRVVGLGPGRHALEGGARQLDRAIAVVEAALVGRRAGVDPRALVGADPGRSLAGRRGVLGLGVPRRLVAGAAGVGAVGVGVDVVAPVLDGPVGSVGGAEDLHAGGARDHRRAEQVLGLGEAIAALGAVQRVGEGHRRRDVSQAQPRQGLGAATGAHEPPAVHRAQLLDRHVVPVEIAGIVREPVREQLVEEPAQLGEREHALGDVERIAVAAARGPRMAHRRRRALGRQLVAGALDQRAIARQVVATHEVGAVGGDRQRLGRAAREVGRGRDVAGARRQLGPHPARQRRIVAARHQRRRAGPVALAVARRRQPVGPRDVRQAPQRRPHPRGLALGELGAARVEIRGDQPLPGRSHQQLVLGALADRRAHDREEPILGVAMAERRALRTQLDLRRHLVGEHRLVAQARCRQAVGIDEACRHQRAHAAIRSAAMVVDVQAAQAVGRRGRELPPHRPRQPEQRGERRGRARSIAGVERGRAVGVQRRLDRARRHPSGRDAARVVAMARIAEPRVDKDQLRDLVDEDALGQLGHGGLAIGEQLDLKVWPARGGRPHRRAGGRDQPDHHDKILTAHGS